jgi:hypothetical protein
MGLSKVQTKELLAQYFPNKGYEALSDLSSIERVHWKLKRAEWRCDMHKRNQGKHRTKWKQFRQSHPDSYKRHKDSQSLRGRDIRIANINWLMEHENVSCSACGFHENFAAISFHHYTGKINIRDTLRYILYLTPEGFQKAWLLMRDRGTFLCANCHMILHYGI